MSALTTIQYGFGSGALFATPSSGYLNTPTLPTPMQFATLQDVSIDFTSTIKELFGRNMFPDVIQTGQMKITGKAKFGRFSAKFFNDLMFTGVGSVSQPGSPVEVLLAINEQGVPTTQAYTCVNSAVWTRDLGCTYLDGSPLACIGSTGTPTLGEYKVAAGVYTIAAADTNANAGIQVSYEYTPASPALGKQISLVNTQIGLTAPFAADFGMITSDSQEMILHLNYCRSSKLTFGTKIEDFTVPEFDFSAAADANGIIGFWQFSGS